MGATPIDVNDADGKSDKLYGWLLIIQCTSPPAKFPKSPYQFSIKPLPLQDKGWKPAFTSAIMFTANEKNRGFL
ncbi:hypothetical protein D3Z53_07250 [Lachnospiraceae bacterium]|nr:hypothetical protein [Lachnospiraceae bacterium]